LITFPSLFDRFRWLGGVLVVRSRLLSTETNGPRWQNRPKKSPSGYGHEAADVL
jgi:hypothetical protein